MSLQVETVTISIRALAWVQEWKKKFNKFLTCTRMVRTRKGTMIGEGFEERQGEDPLEDTASYMPLESQQSRLGESTGLIRDTDLRQIEGLQLEGSDQQRQEVVPPVMAPATTPAPAAVPTLHVDPLFIA